MFGLEKTLRSLTRSPFDSILAAAHRMARPLHFEEGGTVKTQAGGDSHHDDDFVLPFDVREEEVLSEIQDLLRAKRFSMSKRSNGTTSSLKTTIDGKGVVPADLLLQLGDGDRSGEAGAGEDRERDPAASNASSLGDPIGALQRGVIFRLPHTQPQHRDEKCQTNQEDADLEAGVHRGLKCMTGCVPDLPGNQRAKSLGIEAR